MDPASGSATTEDGVPAFRTPDDAPSSAGSSPQAPTLSEWLGGPDLSRTNDPAHATSTAASGGEIVADDVPPLHACQTRSAPTATGAHVTNLPDL